MKLTLCSIVVGVLLLSNLAAVTNAQWGGGRPGGGGAAMSMLLMMPEVRQELKLTTDQIAELEKMQTAMREAYGKFRDPRDLTSDDERREAMREIQAATAKTMEEADAKLEEVLDPDQFDRLLGLFAQRAGADSLSNKHVASAIELSDADKEKIKAKKDELSEEMRTQFGGGIGDRPPRGEGGDRPPRGEGGDRPPRGEGGDRPPRGEGGPGGGFGGDFRERIEKMRTERDEKLLALLTDVQKAKFTELKGETFKFPEQRGGFGGFGGGRPGGGPDGGGGDQPRRRPE